MGMYTKSTLWITLSTHMSMHYSKIAEEGQIITASTLISTRTLTISPKDEEMGTSFQVKLTAEMTQTQTMVMDAKMTVQLLQATTVFTKQWLKESTPAPLPVEQEPMNLPMESNVMIIITQMVMDVTLIVRLKLDTLAQAPQEQPQAALLFEEMAKECLLKAEMMETTLMESAVSLTAQLPLQVTCAVEEAPHKLTHALIVETDSSKELKCVTTETQMTLMDAALLELLNQAGTE